MAAKQGLDLLSNAPLFLSFCSNLNSDFIDTPRMLRSARAGIGTYNKIKLLQGVEMGNMAVDKMGHINSSLSFFAVGGGSTPNTASTAFRRHCGGTRANATNLVTMEGSSSTGLPSQNFQSPAIPVPGSTHCQILLHLLKRFQFFHGLPGV